MSSAVIVLPLDLIFRLFLYSERYYFLPKMEWIPEIHSTRTFVLHLLANCRSRIWTIANFKILPPKQCMKSIFGKKRFQPSKRHLCKNWMAENIPVVVGHLVCFSFTENSKIENNLFVSLVNSWTNNATVRKCNLMILLHYNCLMQDVRGALEPRKGRNTIGAMFEPSKGQ